MKAGDIARVTECEESRLNGELGQLIELEGGMWRMRLLSGASIAFPTGHALVFPREIESAVSPRDASRY